MMMLAVVALLASVPDAEAVVLVEASRARVEQLGTYRVRFTKEERLESGWVGPQVMNLVVRERPFAVLADVVSGPNQGRRFLYDTTQNKAQLRVREPGLLGVLPLWIGIDSALTRDDTRHPVTELGYAFVLRMIERDARLAAGAFTIVEDTDTGRAVERCLIATAPSGVAGLYAQRTRLCFDASSKLLTKVEVWDALGAVERLTFELVEANVKGREVFSREANGL